MITLNVKHHILGKLGVDISLSGTQDYSLFIIQERRNYKSCNGTMETSTEKLEWKYDEALDMVSRLLKSKGLKLNQQKEVATARMIKEMKSISEVYPSIYAIKGNTKNLTIIIRMP